jgi:DNA-directed RNA polymerase sigma subunit (sigma70/sigma32)
VATRKIQIEAELRENPGLSYTELAARLEYTPAQISQAMRTAEVVASLDRESSDATQNLLDTLPDTFAEDPAEQVQNDPRQLNEALSQLTETQRKVVEYRFGVGENAGLGELTLREVADLLEIPLVAVQTAQREAFTLLRDLI